MEAVIAARNVAVARGTEVRQPPLRTAQIETFIFDYGVPLPMLPMVTVRERSRSIAADHRIEPLIAELLKTDLSWSEFRRDI